jgi:tRNA (adenine57-N1/adenine58-N1)-methyltransferase
VTSVVNRLRDHETRKEERRIVQMRSAREKAAKLSPRPAKRKLDEVELNVTPLTTSRPSRSSWKEPPPYPQMIITKPSSEMRGHTSYLTFASYYPDHIRADPEGSDYGSEGLDEVMGTMTEEEMLALGV